MPPLTYTLTGFVNSETSSVVSGAATLSTTYTNTTSADGSPVTITITVGTLSATNYSFPALVNGQITINKADATILITDYSDAFDAAAHTASGTATGVGSVDLSSGLTFASSYTDAPGGSTAWTFAGGTNYNDASGTASVNIGKADATILITDYSGAFDAAAHTASGTATGVGSVDLSSGLTFASSYTDAPGGSTAWTFAGGTNYNDASGTASVNIGKADATILITDYSGVFDAAAHTASGTATGVGSVDLSSGLTFASSYTDAPGGSTAWTFAGGTNYNDASGTASVNIGKADATILITDYSGVFDAAAHTASGTATGVGSVDLSSGLTFALHTRMPLAVLPPGHLQEERTTTMPAVRPV